MNNDGFKPITFTEFSKDCGDTWEGVLEQQLVVDENYKKLHKMMEEDD